MCEVVEQGEKQEKREKRRSKKEKKRCEKKEMNKGKLNVRLDIYIATVETYKIGLYESVNLPAPFFNLDSGIGL